MVHHAVELIDFLSSCFPFRSYMLCFAYQATDFQATLVAHIKLQQNDYNPCCAVRCIITHPTANKVKWNHIRSADIQFELENRFRNYNFFLHWCVLVRTYLDLDFMIIKKQQEKMNIFRMKAIFFRSENVRQNVIDDILVPLEMQIYISHELLWKLFKSSTLFNGLTKLNCHPEIIMQCFTILQMLVRATRLRGIC